MKKKSWNRINITITFCMMFFVFIACFYQTATAKSVIFSNWYSDANWVGYWSSEPQVFFTTLDSSYNVSTDVSTAVKKWNNAGIYSSITVTPSYASIQYYGGTRAQLNGVGFGYTSKNVGCTLWESYTTAADANLSRSVKKLSKVSASTSTAANHLTHVTIHEYGHALGWYGHIPKTGNNTVDRENVMFEEEHSKTTLSSKDKKQLTQVYSKMQ